MPKIILSDGKYRVAGSEVTIYDELPTNVYTVEYSESGGHYLLPSNMSLDYGVLYGGVDRKVDNLFKLYDYTNRSQGAIMSGPRGAGKTLISKVVIARGLERGMPALLVNHAYPDLVKFISSITQPLVVLFDEFEKNFSKGYDMYDGPNRNMGDIKKAPTTQADMLGMFDGTASIYRRIWLITCNNVKLLDENLVNRPGRFYYHFRFPYLTADIIRSVMMTRLPKSRYAEIDKVTQFAETAYPLNYDCLNAIITGLETGTTFEEVLADLNIIPTGFLNFTVEVEFETGTVSDPATVYIRSEEFAERIKGHVLRPVPICVGGNLLFRMVIPFHRIDWKPGLKKYLMRPADYPIIKSLPAGYDLEQYRIKTITLTPNLTDINSPKNFELTPPSIIGNQRTLISPFNNNLGDN